MVRCTQPLTGGIVAEQALTARLRTSLAYAIGEASTYTLLAESSSSNAVPASSLIRERDGWIMYQARRLAIQRAMRLPRPPRPQAMLYVACLSKVFVGLVVMVARKYRYQQ